jgi:hypothetical protein
MTESQAQHDRADDTDDDDTDDDQPDRLVDEVRARIQAARAHKRALQKQQQKQQQEQKARGLGASFSLACTAFVSRVRADLSPRVLALLCCLVLVLAWRRLRVSL